MGFTRPLSPCFVLFPHVLFCFHWRVSFKPTHLVFTKDVSDSFALFVQVRVLGMDLEKGVLDVTMDTELVKVSLVRLIRPFEFRQ